MNAFHTIAVPHRDILEGRLTMDVFAADLWEVFKGRGPDEYKDEKQFFKRTYMTEGLTNLLNTIGQRLQGKGGSPVIQLQTPFGGGKTHSLIAMYHRAMAQKVKTVVIVGEKLKTGKRPSDFETPWGTIEEQLTKKKGDWYSSPVPPGGEQIRTLLERYSPVLILMDEMIPYLNLADAVKAENKTLCSLTLTFLQNLSNVVSSMPKVSLILTATPSNSYDRSERGQEIVNQLQNISERRDIIESPVQDNEISRVIRARLFADVDKSKANALIMDFMDYAARESIVPAGVEPSEYRKRFEESYPFLPEVVDVLYTRWGTFPTFQRTRGVLRLLSMVIYSLKTAPLPYISLADFDLNDQHIRQELLRHIGSEFNGIIAADLTKSDAGAKRVDNSMGDAYRGLKLGSKAATSIFMYSFSGGPERGTTLNEIKRVATTTQNPASAVAEAVEELKNRLFYLQNQGGKYFFSNQPNLWSTLQTRMENLKEDRLTEYEKILLERNTSKDNFKVYVWPKNDSDIPDTPELKLVILKERNDAFIKQIIESKGKTPRVYRNTIFILAPLESEKVVFNHQLRRSIALRQISSEEKTLNLSDDQKKEVNSELKKLEGGMNESLRRYYRLVFIPVKDGVKEQDMGIPTFGEQHWVDGDVYSKLRGENEILEKIAPLVLKERYLKANDYVSTVQLYDTGLNTPGEPRMRTKDVLVKGIEEGVKQGLFGLGELKDSKPSTNYFRNFPSVGIYGNEIIIKAELCAPKIEEPPLYDTKGEQRVAPVGGGAIADQYAAGEKKKAGLSNVHLSFVLPKGKVSGLMGVMNLLQANFNTLKIDLTAEDGTMTERDYDDKIKESFRQMGVDINESSESSK